MRRSEDRRRTAFHESAHAVAALVLLGPESIAVASVEPRLRWLGVVGVNDRILDLWDDPPAMRQRLHDMLVVYTAGRQAEKLLEADHSSPPTLGKPHRDPDEVQAVVAPAPLTEAQQAFLEAGDDDDLDLRSDFHAALDIADRWVGPGAGTDLVARVEGEAAELLRSHWSRVQALASALLEHGSLAGDDVVAVLAIDTSAPETARPRPGLAIDELLDSLRSSL